METFGNRKNSTLDRAVKDFETLHADGVIDDNLYFKCLVSLAYEYSENQELEQSARLVFTCPPEYYQSVLPIQVREDKQYRDCVIRLTYYLVKAGYIEFEKEPLELFTPTAKA